MSFIPAGHDPSIFLCRSLNKDLKKNRIGVMLALAILTQFFYCLNQRKSDTNTKKGSIPPTISPAERKARGNSPPTASEKENFGIGINKRNVTDENGGNAFQTTDSSSEDIMVILYKQREHNSTKTRDDSQERREPIDDSVALDEDCLSDILYRSLCMLQIGETISNLSKSNSFNIRDLGFMDDVLQTLHASDSNENEGGENQRRPDSVLESYGFARCPVLGDGDCLLTASFLQLLRLLHSETLLNHLSCIGLTPTTAISIVISKLRKLIVAEWLENEDYYGLRNLCLNEQDIISYEENGVYGGALGDAMPLALANVLRLPTILFTSIENFPVVVVSPRQQVPDAQPLFLAYQQQGPGHYDIAEFQQAPATSSTPQPEIVEKDLTLPEIQSCRCGQGRDRKELNQDALPDSPW